VVVPVGLTSVVVFGVVVVLGVVAGLCGDVLGLAVVPVAPVACPEVVPVVPAPVVLWAAAIPAANSRATAIIINRVRILAPGPSQA
jgi:hypothetical protein